MARFADMYGWASVEPATPVVAGSFGTFALTYHVGRYGIDDGGIVKIAVRFASDWGYPQFDDPRGPNFASVHTTGRARLACRFDPKGYVRPYQKCLVIDVSEWSLAEGDTLTVVYGDTSGGSPGTAVQTFCEATFEFRVVVDPFGTGEGVELEDPPVLRILPAAAARLVLVAPTQVAVGEPFAVGVKVEDAWGNPAAGFAGSIELGAVDGVAGLARRLQLGDADGGARRLAGARCTRPGTYRLSASSEGVLSASSNPIVAVGGAPEYRPFWGDLHGQSEETVGTNSVDAYFRFARDRAMVDFVGHQGNDFQVTPLLWDEVNRCCRAFDEPGRFVTFPGYEWSAMTPAGGDHNVYYLREGEPIFRTSHWQVAEERSGPRRDLAGDRYPISELYDELRGRDAMVIPHIGGRPANLAFHDPELEPLIEIYSAWGQFEWLLREAVERGYRVGFVAGSDDHKGRPGASYPGSSSFGVYGGLTCVLAPELTRAALWQALRERRCYATTGQRIFLDVRAGDHWMGEAFHADAAPCLRIAAAGTADIEEVRLMRGLEVVRTWPREMPRDRRRVRFRWSGARIRGRARIACWDGELRLSGGRLRAAEPYAFDSAAERLVLHDEGRVSWTSVTSGDEDGMVLTVEGDASTHLDFASRIVDFGLSLGELDQGPRVIEAGGEELRVQVEYLPLGLESNGCCFDFVDPAPPPGWQAYWVRLTQIDGGHAWSSPLYIHTGA